MAYQIAVLVRQVPDLNAARINHATGEIQFSGQMVINSFDDYAIEEAIRLKEAHGGEITVVSAGPAGAKDAIVRALAMGADKGLLVGIEDADKLDAAALAAVLAEAVRPLQPDIVLCGQMSDDFGAGEVGPALAVALGMPQVSSATSITANGSSLTILRDTEDGKQQVSVDTPVLIMAMTGLNEPRYPSLKGIMAAKKKPVDVVSPALVPESLTTWSTPFTQDRDATGIVIEGVPAADAARQLVTWLKEKKLV